MHGMIRSSAGDAMQQMTKLAILLFLLLSSSKCHAFLSLSPHIQTHPSKSLRIHIHSIYRHHRMPRLTTTSQDENSEKILNPFKKAIRKFQSKPGTYLLIPCIAALVGWVTNWLAVQMIFYPIHPRGIKIYTIPENPLGFLTWQGIVPCKTRTMSEAMVDMITSQLLPVHEAFARLDPRKVATLLAPEVPKLTQEILFDVLPIKWLAGLPSAVYQGLDGTSQSILNHFNIKFLEQLTRSMQANIDDIFNLKSCVVDQMLQDRTKLGQLFRKCGQKELDFLTNSGLWFGFLLGIIQMIVALFWENPWTLSIGGGIVGTATNWLALKWIFEPVNPTSFGPFVLQGQFLRRQKEVAAEFSHFFASKILTAEKLWDSILNNPETKPKFHAMFTSHFTSFLSRVTRGFNVDLEPETMRFATAKAIEKLPDHVPVLYDYMDRTLGLEKTLRIKMEQMTSAQFERVLHPIFEEDELTLILAGAVLGFLAGLIQQGIETGAIQVPNLWKPFRKLVVQCYRAPRQESRRLVRALAVWIQLLTKRVVSFPKRLQKWTRHFHVIWNPFQRRKGPNGTNK